MGEADLISGRPQSSPVASDQLTIHNILMATDFSDCSARALGYALGIARRYESRLHLFHCIDPTPYNLLEPAAIHMTCEDVQRELEQIAWDLRHQDRSKDVDTHVVVNSGELAATLRQAVTNLDLDLIVVGTHGRSGWRKLVLGSVAETIVALAACPVLSVGPSSGRRRIQEFGPENVLLVYGGSAHSELAESYAGSLSHMYGSQITAIDVLENRAGRVLAKVSQLELPEADGQGSALGSTEPSPPQLPTEIGTESDLILQVADQAAADLIVLVVPPAHRIAARFHSTSSYRVICGARCPVLSVHGE